MTDHPELDLAAPYVLDAIEDLERARFNRHLQRCAECRDEVEALRLGLEGLVVEASAEPPAAVRDEVLAGIESQPQLGPRKVTPGASQAAPTAAGSLGDRRRLMIAAVAAVAALVVALGLVLRPSRPSLEALVERDDTRIVALDPTAGGRGLVEVVVSGDGETAYLLATGLEALGPGLTYEAWIIGDAGPMAAGLFNPDGDIVVSIDGAIEPGWSVGVTVEPTGGSPAPTGEILFLSEI